MRPRNGDTGRCPRLNNKSIMSAYCCRSRYLAIAVLVIGALYITQVTIVDNKCDHGEGANAPQAYRPELMISAEQAEVPEVVSARDEDQPTVVLLMAYMRGGSSFFGSTFSRNPAAFYLYEPMWELYNAMTAVPAMTYPIHNLYTAEGQEREMTSYEHDYIINGLTQMFNCEFDQLPTEALVNWWTTEKEGHSGYFRCLVHSNATTETRGYPLHCQARSRVPATNTSLTNHCNPWIHKSFNRGCHAFMAEAHGRPFAAGFERSSLPPVKPYRDCTEEIQRGISHCLPLRINGCKSRKIRAAKLLRLRMRHVEDIIKRFPKVKVVHQLRDPRGTVSSRLNNYRLAFRRLDEEARGLCRKMVADIKERLVLQDKYPGVFLETKYEDLADNISKVVTDIYAHIGHEAPQQVYDILVGVKKNKGEHPFATYRANSTRTAHAWLTTMGAKDKALIDGACKELYHLADYPL